MLTVQDSFRRFSYAMDGEIGSKTLKWYRSHLSSLVEKYGNRDITTITPDDLREWRYEQFHCATRYHAHPVRPTEKGELSDFTKRGRIRALKRFFGWLTTEGLIPQNPAASLRLPRKPKNREPKAISEKDIYQILKAAEHPRDVALLNVLVDSGARIGGLTSLRLSDVSEDYMTLSVTEKGKKTRQVYMTEEGAEKLKEWLEQRPNAPNDYVFISTKNNEPMSESGMYQALKRLAKAIGITRFNPHSFRHAFARGLIEAGASLETVRKLLGHSSVLVTASCYLVWTQSEIRQQHLKYSEIRKRKREEQYGNESDS